MRDRRAPEELDGGGRVSVAAKPRSIAVASERARSARWALAGLSLSMLMASLDTSIANAGLPTLARAFGASFPQVQWIVLAYLLSVTALVVGAGRLGDLFGRRSLLLSGISLFTLASLGCGFAPSLPLLIVSRAAQGMGAAVMMALTVAFVGETVSQEKTGAAMGLLGTMSAIGTALGPSLGGFIISGLGWPAIFLLNVPLGLIALGLVRRHLPKDRPAPKAERAAFDFVGTSVFALSLAAYALALTFGDGEFGPVNAALMGLSVLGIVVFVFVERRTNSPLLRLAMFRDRALSGSLVAGALVSTVIMSTLVVGPFYLSRTFGLDAVSMGLALSVGPAVVALSGVPAGRAADRFGAGRTTAAGLVAMAIGTLLLSLTPTVIGVAGYVLPIVVVTAGYALFQTSNNAFVMDGVPIEQRGVVSGMLGLSRNLGLITGASAMGAVFALASGATDITTAQPAAISFGMRATFGVGAALIAAALVVARASRAGTVSDSHKS
ncbi:MFS transporter [bacterium]|nr:MAG: MFS transporter [bacterium]